MKKLLRKIIDSALNSLGYYLDKLPRTSRKNFGTIARELYLEERFKSINDVKGDIVECGVGSGTSLFYMCVLNQLENKNRTVYGFDSFEGFPEPTKEDDSIRKPKKGEMDRGWASSTDGLRNSFIGMFQGREFNFSLRLMKGFFEDSLNEDVIEIFRTSKIALLHLDVDLYDSYKVTLERLWPHVAEGGVVLFDEYRAAEIKFPGSVVAIDEFFGELKSQIQYDENANRYYIVKNGQ